MSLELEFETYISFDVLYDSIYNIQSFTITILRKYKLSVRNKFVHRKNFLPSTEANTSDFDFYQHEALDVCDWKDDTKLLNEEIGVLSGSTGYMLMSTSVLNFMNHHLATAGHMAL